LDRNIFVANKIYNDDGKGRMTLSPKERVIKKEVSYWWLLRFIFVIFFLLLLRDIFYQWDGFRYYASFSEFLPSIALALSLWSIVAVCITAILWFSVRGAEWFCRHTGINVTAYHLLFCTGIFLLFCTWGWNKRDLMLPFLLTYNIERPGIYLTINLILLSACITFLIRNRVHHWLMAIQERVTPLVWIYIVLIAISVLSVVYHAWIKDTKNLLSENLVRHHSDDKNKPNIILLTFDALSARDISLYGYYRETTPFIRKWAGKSTVFTRVEAEDNITTPTTASLMTGKRVWTHRTYHQGGSKPVRSDSENLPMVLKKKGYYTIALVSNNLASVKTLGIKESFDIAPHYTDFIEYASILGWHNGKHMLIDILLHKFFDEKIRMSDWVLKSELLGRHLFDFFTRDFSVTTTPPEKIFNTFFDIIDNKPIRPFFAWIHVFPPHSPYLPPKPYIGMFNDSSELRTYIDQEHGSEDWNLFRARYDEFIRYCDKKFEDFIGELERRDILENTVVIISSDHGESFEHEYFQHGKDELYEQVTHIPLIIRGVKQIKGITLTDLVEQIDIPPTILDFAGIQIPMWMEGRSLVPLILSEKLPSKPAYSMNLRRNLSLGKHEIQKGTIAVWEGDYKLIHYLEKEKSMLFNLQKDDGELNNIIEDEPGKGQHLLSLIKGNLTRANERIRSAEMFD
jgi:arylsulfatase A-like enzyme